MDARACPRHEQEFRDFLARKFERQQITRHSYLLSVERRVDGTGQRALPGGDLVALRQEAVDVDAGLLKSGNRIAFARSFLRRTAAPRALRSRTPQR